MRFLLDENVPVQVDESLRGSGREVGLVPSGLQNGEVVALARKESRILITQDKDFANRVLYPPGESPGMIILRIHPPHPDKLVSALRAFLSASKPTPLAGKLVLLEEDRYHILS